MKTALKILLLAGVLGYMVFAIVKMSRDSDKRICRGTRISLVDNARMDFVDSAFVASLIQSAKLQTVNCPIKDLDIIAIEQTIKKSPYIDSVVCYYTPGDLMCIRVVPRNPIIHVMADNGEDYYMDGKGNDMPSNRFPLDLCLATGSITKQFAKDNLLEMARFISTNSPWDKDIQQIHVRSPRHIELIPSIEGQTIILGEPTNIEDKLKRLSAFYENCLSKAGWNKYSIINLNYADQVVCTKKKHKK